MQNLVQFIKQKAIKLRILNFNPKLFQDSMITTTNLSHAVVINNSVNIMTHNWKE